MHWGPPQHPPPRPHSVPREIFPYLVVVIGLENGWCSPSPSSPPLPVDLEVSCASPKVTGGDSRWRRGLCCTSSCRGNGEPRSLPRPGLH